MLLWLTFVVNDVQNHFLENLEKHRAEHQLNVPFSDFVLRNMNPFGIGRKSGGADGKKKSK